MRARRYTKVQVEAAKPHVYKAYDAAVTAAAPYVKMATEAAEPHVAKAMAYVGMK